MVVRTVITPRATGPVVGLDGWVGGGGEGGSTGQAGGVPPAAVMLRLELGGEWGVWREGDGLMDGAPAEDDEEGGGEEDLDVAGEEVDGECHVGVYLHDRSRNCEETFADQLRGLVGRLA